MSYRWFVLPALVGIGVAGFFLIRSLDDDLVYYFYTSEAVERRADFPDGRRFRIAGVVVPDSIAETADGYTFSITDGGATVEVNLVSTPPPLFQADVEVLLDGAWLGEVFVADGALIRHEEGYEAPDEGHDPTAEPDA